MVQDEEQAVRGSGVLHQDTGFACWLCDLGQVASQIPHLSNGTLHIYNDDKYLVGLLCGSVTHP